MKILITLFVLAVLLNLFTPYEHRGFAKITVVTCGLLILMPRFIKSNLEILAVYVHEVSHGLAALLSGGNFVKFQVRRNKSGVAWTTGGYEPLIYAAGYVGTILVGAYFLIMSSFRFGQPFVAMIVLALICLFATPRAMDLFTAVIGIFLAVVLTLSAFADMVILAIVLNFFGILFVWHGIDALITLYRLSRDSHVHTDAKGLSQLMGRSPVFWSISLSAVSIITGAYMFSMIFR